MTEVWDSPPVSQGQLLVLLALADNADEDTRSAWPSVKTLARKTVLSERQVQHCLRSLAEKKIIDIEPNAGPAGTNVYRVRKPSEWGGEKTAGGELHFTGGVNSTSPGGVNSTSPEPSYRTIKEPSLMLGDDFDAFWRAWPRKVGRGQAERAYKSALKRAPHDAIMAGLSRQLPKLRSTDPKYVPHASTWLNGMRWEDQDTAEPTKREPAIGERMVRADGTVVEWEGGAAGWQQVWE
jgi:hypothetical protein